MNNPPGRVARLHTGHSFVGSVEHGFARVDTSMSNPEASNARRSGNSIECGRNLRTSWTEHRVRLAFSIIPLSKKCAFGKSCGQVRQPRVPEPLARAHLHFTALFEATLILEDVRPSASTGSPMRQAMWRSSDPSRRAFKPFPHPGAGQHLVAGGRGPQRGPVEIPRSALPAMVRLRVCRVERRGAVGVHPGEAATRHERLLVVVLRALVPPMLAATSLAPRAAAATQDPRSSRRRWTPTEPPSG